MHVILTDYGSGTGVRSPQMPELFSGYAQLFEAQAALAELLDFGGAPAGAIVVQHREYVALTPDDRIVQMRVADDAAFSQRAIVLGSIRRDFEATGEELLDLLFPTSLGEYVVIAALQDDSLEWLAGQADRPGEPVNVGWHSPDGTLHFTSLRRGGDLPGTPSKLVEDGSTTVGQLVASGSISTKDTSQLQLV
ncbi:MAG: hypothetical protein PGN11_05475 [Quadrisphaera sp.]